MSPHFSFLKSRQVCVGTGCRGVHALTVLSCCLFTCCPGPRTIPLPPGLGLRAYWLRPTQRSPQPGSRPPVSLPSWPTPVLSLILISFLPFTLTCNVVTALRDLSGSLGLFSHFCGLPRHHRPSGAPYRGKAALPALPTQDPQWD